MKKNKEQSEQNMTENPSQTIQKQTSHLIEETSLPKFSNQDNSKLLMQATEADISKKQLLDEAQKNQLLKDKIDSSD